MTTWQDQREMLDRLANDVKALLRAVDILETCSGTSALGYCSISTDMHVFDDLGMASMTCRLFVWNSSQEI